MYSLMNRQFFSNSSIDHSILYIESSPNIKSSLLFGTEFQNSHWYLTNGNCKHEFLTKQKINNFFVYKKMSVSIYTCRLTYLDPDSIYFKINPLVYYTKCQRWLKWSWSLFDDSWQKLMKRCKSAKRQYFSENANSMAIIKSLQIY